MSMFTQNVKNRAAEKRPLYFCGSRSFLPNELITQSQLLCATGVQSPTTATSKHNGWKAHYLHLSAPSVVPQTRRKWLKRQSERQHMAKYRCSVGRVAALSSHMRRNICKRALNCPTDILKYVPNQPGLFSLIRSPVFPSQICAAKSFEPNISHLKILHFCVFITHPVSKGLNPFYLVRT